MISVEEALERILANLSPLAPERKPLLEAMGQVLAEDIVSDIDIPPLDNAAMDGYAVRWEDTRGASDDAPVTLRVIGEVAAGYMAQAAVAPGTAIRIMTGAPVPEGADAVVQFEDTDEAREKAKAGHKRDSVKVFRPAKPRLNIRDAGEDVHRGEQVVPKGTVLRPAEIGVLSSLGRAQVQVIRRPRVAILSTGDELVGIDEPLSPGKIRNSNSYSLAALVQRYGGIPVMLGIARDVVNDLTAKLRQAQGCDMLLTSGGVSMGDYDVVKDVLAMEGEIGFWQVQMKPGKPLAFGRLGDVPHLGLPGNPVSSMVVFEQFGRPAVLKMLGKTNFRKPEVQAILDTPARNNDGRRCFYRAWVERRDGEWHARLTGPQGSGILTSMMLANGLVIIPEDVRRMEPGERVRAQMLDWPEEVVL
ncbi:MAG: molybdopterin molybdotransferase MoeA [Bacteroidetes bacterium]|nr:molybdopterin molybdotransferase MoeA [Bacteroidota bacterium]MCL5026988.1 molybdopterin molybdotransferase MoeA [Chloroflexota bacterium]